MNRFGNESTRFDELEMRAFVGVVYSLLKKLRIRPVEGESLQLILSDIFFSLSSLPAFILPDLHASQLFTDWLGLSNQWTQLLITSNYYLPSMSKDITQTGLVSTG